MVIKLDGVHKDFGTKKVLNNISLSVAKGRIVGLLGSNGVGKSTLLRHIIGLYLPDAGTVTTLGVDAAKLSAKELGRIGYVHQEGELIDWMTVRQLLDYVRTYYSSWNMDLQERFIADYDISLKARVGTLSPGQRQIVSILIATAFGPDLLILDEPASALDPIARGKFLDFLLELIQNENRTIIISSHILSDVEKVIDHVLIMGRGGILRDCSFDDLREQFCRVTITASSGHLPEKLPFTDIIEYQKSGSRASMIVRNSQPAKIERQAADINCTAEIKPMTLDEIYKAVVM
ncbi:MAG: ABC transporter ATP-binding protein [Sedimentisphaerales bacterium]|nr:ABC transporter ATP-binding protein [Sedimentisphaerales bacterium]